MESQRSTTYEDVAGESFRLFFEDHGDASRFFELAHAFPALSADELLICIEQREGQSHLWKDFERSITRTRGKRPRTRADLVRSPAVSGEQANEFLASFAWIRLRMFVLERDGAKCACCGRTRKDGVKLNVDHIKPRKTHPELALDPDNLQVLCNVCNLGKGNVFETDWRTQPA